MLNDPSLFTAKRYKFMQFVFLNLKAPLFKIRAFMQQQQQEKRELFFSAAFPRAILAELIQLLWFQTYTTEPVN